MKGLLPYHGILCHLTCVNRYFLCMCCSELYWSGCLCECDLAVVTWAAGRIRVTWPGLAWRVCMEYPDPVKRLVKSRLLYCMTWARIIYWHCKACKSDTVHSAPSLSLGPDHRPSICKKQTARTRRAADCPPRVTRAAAASRLANCGFANNLHVRVTSSCGDTGTRGLVMCHPRHAAPGLDVNHVFSALMTYKCLHIRPGHCDQRISEITHCPRQAARHHQPRAPPWQL